MFSLIKRLLGGGDSVPRVRREKPPPISVEDLRQLLMAHEQASIWLTPTDVPRFSKLGGAPDLEGIAWPTNAGGEPMAFVAQLDLADVRTAGGPEWLPATGALYFFAETQSNHPGGGGRVIYLPDRPVGLQTPTPPGAEEFGERHVGLEAHASYPSTDWLNVTERCFDFEDDEAETVSAFGPGRNDDEADHRCGGYPAEVQDGYFAPQCELWIGARMCRSAPSQGTRKRSKPLTRRPSNTGACCFRSTTTSQLE